MQEYNGPEEWHNIITPVCANNPAQACFPLEGGTPPGLPVCRMLLKVRLQFWMSNGKAYVSKLQAETTWMDLEFLMVPEEFTYT